MKELLILLIVTFANACPESCKCTGQQMSCEIPDERNMPSLENSESITSLDLSGNNILNIFPNSIKNFPNLEELILNGNKIYFLENGAFKGVPHLKKLSIQNNNLHFIEKEVFSDLPLLEELHLEDNSLTVLPSLKKNKALKKLCLTDNSLETIPNDAFTTNTQLAELKLKRNKLSHLPRSAFPQSLASFVMINLVGNNFRSIPDVVKGMTNLEKLSLCHNPIKVFQAGDFRSFTKLKMLSMTNIGLFKVTDNLFSISSLEELYMGRNSIQADSLTKLQLPSLKTLVVNKNNIGDISAANFLNTGNLEKLDLSDCGISNIAGNFFLILRNLKELNLQNNKLDQIPSLTFQTKLEKLNLNGNNINQITENDFRTLNLKSLCLSNNSLSTLEPNTSQSLQELLSLDLSHNQLEEIPSLVLPGLEMLNISNNQIENLSNSSFATFSNLTTLNMKENNITELSEDVFQHLINLKELFLCGNQLDTLNSAALNSLPSLEVITADKNSIQEIDGNTFSNNLNLKKISLNYNNIFSVSRNCFKNLTNLQELWLLYNDIKKTPVLEKNLNLKTLGLCGNPLENLPDGSLDGPVGLEVLLLREIGLTEFSGKVLNHYNKIRYLNLANGNKLTQVPEVIKKMTSLEILKLTGNHIRTICFSDFTGLDRLKELRLDNMMLHSIDVASFFPAIPALRTLYMSGNPWHCGCDLEWFALGVDGQRADIKIMDRQDIKCDSPPRYKGRRLDFLRLGDFKQCIPSAVMDVETVSVRLRLPYIEFLSQDYKEVFHQVTYQPVGGGREIIKIVRANQREAVLEELSPGTTYVVCINTITSSGMSLMDEEELLVFPSEEREMCHEFTTAGSVNIRRNTKKVAKISISTHLVAIYAAIGGVLFFALVGVTISTTVWCRRGHKESSYKKKQHVDYTDFDLESPAANNRRINGKNDHQLANKTPAQPNNDKNGIKLISKNEVSRVNEACDVIGKDARTKL